MEIKSQKAKSIKGVILMVDDNPKNLQILGNLLNNEGYSVEFALHGQAALDWIKKKDFDLILLDVMMPELGGFEVCRILKADVKYKDIPVIFLTAQTDMNYIIQGFDLGAVDYVHKPFNKQELLSRVSIHLELKKSRDIIEQYARDLEFKNSHTFFVTEMQAACELPAKQRCAGSTPAAVSLEP